MNFSRTSLYAAAFVMGCLSLNSAVNAQVRVVSETPGSSSVTTTTRPPYYSSTSPGGSGSSTGSTRPPYYSSTSPGGSGGSSTGYSRPDYISSASPVVGQGQQEPTLKIAVYPNPATEILYVEVSGLRPDESVFVNVLNDRGARFSVPMERSGESIRIQVGNLPRGGYYIQVITNSSEVVRSIELI